jgi:hypothetical protein
VHNSTLIKKWLPFLRLYYSLQSISWQDSPSLNESHLVPNADPPYAQLHIGQPEGVLLDFNVPVSLQGFPSAIAFEGKITTVIPTDKSKKIILFVS